MRGLNEHSMPWWFCAGQQEEVTTPAVACHGWPAQNCWQSLILEPPARILGQNRLVGYHSFTSRELRMKHSCQPGLRMLHEKHTPQRLEALKPRAKACPSQGRALGCSGSTGKSSRTWLSERVSVLADRINLDHSMYLYFGPCGLYLVVFS